MLVVLLAVLLVVLCFGSILLNLVALPGNWLVVVWVALYSFVARHADHWSITWRGVLLVAALAVAGEVMEFVTGMWGARRAGGTRRSALGAFAGSLGGSMIGLLIGVPIPVIGSLLAAVLFGAFGAMAGAVVAEWSGHGRLQHSIRVGRGAFWGRFAATIGKLLIGLLMCGVILLLLWW